MPMTAQATTSLPRDDHPLAALDHRQAPALADEALARGLHHTTRLHTLVGG
jgi:hypothetical protein